MKQKGPLNSGRSICGGLPSKASSRFHSEVHFIDALRGCLSHRFGEKSVFCYNFMLLFAYCYLGGFTELANACPQGDHGVKHRYAKNDGEVRRYIINHILLTGQECLCERRYIDDTRTRRKVCLKLCLFINPVKLQIRLKIELELLLPTSCAVNVHASMSAIDLRAFSYIVDETRRHAAYCGASVLAGLSYFDNVSCSLYEIVESHHCK